MALNQEQLNAHVDNKFVAVMLEIEKHYQAPHSSFQKYEKIRIEQWVNTSETHPLVQEAMHGDLEPAVEEEQEPIQHAASGLDPQQEAGQALHQDATRRVTARAVPSRSCNLSGTSLVLESTTVREI